MAATKTKYFRAEKIFLLYGGNSLDEDRGLVYKIYSIFVLLFCNSYPFLMTADLLTQNFNEAVNGWFYTIGTVMDTALAFFGYIGRKDLGKLLKKLEEPPFTVSKERGNIEQERETLNAWFSFFKKQTVLLLCGAFSIIIYRTVYSLTKKYRYGECILPWSPVTMINITYSPNYELVWFYQNSAYLYYCCNTIPMVLITTGCLSFISVQFKILHRYLERILDLSREEKFKGALSLSNKNDLLWRRLNEHIKRAVTYHLEITKATEQVDRIFNKAFLCVFIVTLLMICVNTYQASMLPHFNLKLIFLLTETLTIFSPSLVYCYYGEKITHESEQIGQVSYEIDFINTDVRFQKSLMMIIRQSQKPLKIKAGNLIEGSVTVVVWILRTSFSTYMMLRTLNAPQ